MAGKSTKRTASGKGIRRPPTSPIRKESGTRSGEAAHLPWGRRNFLILGAGAAAIVIGFLLLATGDRVFGPILLVGAYLGLIPWGILASPGGRRRTGAPGAPEAPPSRSGGE